MCLEASAPPLVEVGSAHVPPPSLPTRAFPPQSHAPLTPTAIHAAFRRPTAPPAVGLPARLPAPPPLIVSLATMLPQLDGPPGPT